MSDSTDLSLRSVYAKSDYTWRPTVKAVVAAAPLLQVLTAEEVTCTWQDAPRMLRAEPPFAPLQMRHGLDVRFDEDRIIGGTERFGPFVAALADTTLQPALSELRVRFADTAQPALMGALVDAALARRLRALTLDSCTPPAAAQLARLLAEGSLAAFEIDGGTPLCDAADAVLVADALRMNTTLTRLSLLCGSLCRDMRVAGAILAALVGHPSLHVVHIIGEIAATEDLGAFGAALAALIAADAPALQTFNCSCNSLGDAGLAPIVEALPLNRNLRTLDMEMNELSEAFTRERLLPAVRANTTLCKLRCHNYFRGQAAAEAETLVRNRARG